MYGHRPGEDVESGGLFTMLKEELSDRLTEPPSWHTSIMGTIPYRINISPVDWQSFSKWGIILVMKIEFFRS